VEVYALGGGLIYINGLPLTGWPGPLVRNLFFYLVDRPLLTRQDIFDAFWPTIPTKEAVNVFHVTKSKIDQWLGLELTTYKAGFYRPSGQFELHYDVSAFEAATPQSEADYKAVSSLYHSRFLPDVDLPWVRSRRRELQSQYAELLLGLARLYHAAGQIDLAISYYGKAWQQAPEREDVARHLMELCAASGKVEQAVQVFEHLSRVL
jgi:two-component SAPR family response regulator